ncbi:hypothetical protein LGL08_00135 [Clostridium estertheticum]|nr:hypothetical protein [Clostridium estertheticum]MCB2347978.1 hypothetical protein [Clostridium estertheticum]
MSKILLLNAFPLGLSRESAVHNEAGFYIKNSTPTKFSGEIRKEINKYSLSYLKLILSVLPNIKIITLGTYARDKIKKLGFNSRYHMHPSPQALNPRKITEEYWIKEFIKEF